MKPMNLPDFLDQLRENASQFLQPPTLSQLRQAVEQGIREQRVLLSPTLCEPVPVLFGPWASIQTKLIKKRGDGKWQLLSADFWTIIQMSSRNDTDGYRRFYKLFDKFRTRSLRLAAQVELGVPETQDSEMRVPCRYKALRLFPERTCYLAHVRDRSWSFDDAYDSLQRATAAVAKDQRIQPTEWEVFTAGGRDITWGH